MKRVTSLLLAQSVMMTAFLASFANATVVISQSLEEMAQTAPIIVEGTVEQVQTQWAESAARIYTYAEISVSRPLKGKVKSTVLVKQPGGIIGELGHSVAGAARFKTGEKVLLFLEPAVDEDEVYLVWSMAAGKISFRENNLGEMRAQRDLEGLSFYPATSVTGKTVRRVEQPVDFGTPEAALRRVQKALQKLNGGAR